MTAFSVLLALFAALGNAAASVLQRRAAAEEAAPSSAPDRRWSWAVRLARRPVWLWGAALLALSGLCQAAALATGPLSVVQPVMTTELLFTLAIGGIVFRRRPDRRTWWAFLAMATGLAVFLALLEPSGERATVPGVRWLWTAVAVAAVVVALVAVSPRLPSAPRAAVLGTATALGFACTAALIKDATGRLDEGVAALFTAWQLYTAFAVGLGSFLLLQVTLRAGTLVASQPALTLGDALLSVVLGSVLFGEHVELGLRILPEAAALAVLLAGTAQLARSPLLAGDEEKEAAW
ncbi:DMT family transporter [Streptomyces sp. NPDC049597]|uniref:DMT family transporter n=1 Tax=Streptomyces sp. NPDC049597 TaxID=3155276 RepID=UPI00343F3D4F